MTMANPSRLAREIAEMVGAHRRLGMNRAGFAGDRLV